jgi:hypothetical protein
LTGQDKTSNSNCTETAKQIFYSNLQREEEEEEVEDGKIFFNTLLILYNATTPGTFSVSSRADVAHMTRIRRLPREEEGAEWSCHARERSWRLWGPREPGVE